MRSSIKNFINEARNDGYVIPEFQRDFTWKEKQIEKLFDSIFEKYPLPKLFIWKAPNQITVFKFLSELKTKSNDISHRTDAYAVCDGQQRLTSILIGVSEKGDKSLYFNLLPKNHGLSEEDETMETEDRNDSIDDYTLNFIFDSERGTSRNRKGWECSVKVSDVFRLLEDNNSLNSFVLNLNGVRNQPEEVKYSILDRVGQLKLQLTRTDYLDFEDITDYIGNDLDKAIEFFTRINDGGKKLSKNDLLFSIVSKFITKDENRSVILKEDFQNIKNKYKDFKIDSDFILRVCLYVAGENILFKIDNFTQFACNKILNNWEEIKRSIENVLNELYALGIRKLMSKNSIIPIIYHYYIKQQLNDPITNSEKYEILKYIIKSNYSKIFGDHGDLLLSNFKQKQVDKYNQGSKHFSCSDFQNNLPTGKRFVLGEDIIEKSIWNNELLAKPIFRLLYGEDYISGDYYISQVINNQIDLRMINVPEGDIFDVKSKLKTFANYFLDETEGYTNGLLSKIGDFGLITPHVFQSRDDLSGINLRNSLIRREVLLKQRLTSILN